MAYWSVDLGKDLPNPQKRKKIIFYYQGIKIYGHLPYILNRKLKGQFFSNYIMQSHGMFKGSGLITPTWEDNYTAIGYDQTLENWERFANWLLMDKGFEYAIASQSNFQDDIFQANIGQEEPNTWVPLPSEWQQGSVVGFQKLLTQHIV